MLRGSRGWALRKPSSTNPVSNVQHWTAQNDFPRLSGTAVSCRLNPEVGEWRGDRSRRPTVVTSGTRHHDASSSCQGRTWISSVATSTARQRGPASAGSMRSCRFRESPATPRSPAARPRRDENRSLRHERIPTKSKTLREAAFGPPPAAEVRKRTELPLVDAVHSTTSVAPLVRRYRHLPPKGHHRLRRRGKRRSR